MMLGGIDVGTTGCKLTVYDSNGNFVSKEYVEYDVSRNTGEHEIDAEKIFDAVGTVLKKTCEKVPDLCAVGITTFGETFATLDDEDNVLLPSMLYTDMRGCDETAELADRLSRGKISQIAGVSPHEMYSLPKIMWIKKNRPDVYGKIKRILLMEDFIVYRLTGVAQIDYSLAARTMGLDMKNRCWSGEIFDAAGVDMSLMSKPVPTGTLAGCIKENIAKELGISPDIKIVSGCHDQVAAAVGAGVFETSRAVDGTGTVECVTAMLDKIPENAEFFEGGFSIAPYIFDGTYLCYALSFTGGAVLKWYRDNFAKHEAELAEKNGENVYAHLDNSILKNPTGILVLPHFAGAATPYMDTSSKAAMVGITLETTAADIYKALMEGVTYEILFNIRTLEKFGIQLETLIATGGGASSDVWLQIKADVLKRNIETLQASEAGACGTCMLAGVAAGVFSDIYEAAEKYVKNEKAYTPNTENAEIYQKYYAAYEKLYSSLRPIVEGMRE